MKRCFYFLSLAGLSAIYLTAAPVQIHVSPQGNDHWTGRFKAPAASDAGQSDGPQATLEAALAATRALKTNGTSADGISIVLHSGVYELKAPLTIGPEDSGADAKHPFTIEAYRGERPVLSGGRSITGWHRVEGTP